MNRGYSVDFADWWEFDFAPTVLGGISFIIPIQVLLVLIALVAAMFGRASIKNQLGLARPRLSVVGWFLVLYGTLGLYYLNQQFVTLLMSSFWPQALAGPGSWRHFYVQAGYSPTAWFTVFAIVTAAVGFSEGLLYRGFAQRRLLKRLPAIPAIGLPTILFALAHYDFYLIVGVFLLGLWFGILAWRTESIWPAVFAHALTNLYICLIIRLGVSGSWMHSESWAVFILLVILPTIALIGALIYLVAGFRETPTQHDEN